MGIAATIRKGVIKRRILRYNKKAYESKNTSFDFEKADSVFLVSDIKDFTQFAEMRKIVASLQSDFAKVHCLCVAKTSKLPESLPKDKNITVLTRKMTTPRKLPKEEFIKPFVNQQYGLLLNICRDSQPAGNFFTGMIHADLKCGGSFLNYQDLFDLTLKTGAPKDFSPYFKTLYNYISQIRIA